MLHFFLAQLRWEHKMRISPTNSFAEFDAQLRVIDPEHQGKDVQEMSELMKLFFIKSAKGDKWVPMHAVLGDHELYIMERINSLTYLSEQE